MNRPRKKWQVIIIVLVIILALPLTVFIVGQFTPVLSAWIFGHVIDLTSYSTPSNFESIKGNVAAKVNLTYDADGTQLDIYYPQKAESSLPVIMWIHGGGFIGGSKQQTEAYGMTLANAGYVVANINYDLAPRYQYPVPVIQANHALKYLSEQVGQFGGDINRLFVGGNSSGAQIASQLAAVISNPTFAEKMGIQPTIANKQLRGVLLYCGAYDMRTVMATHFFGLDLFLWSYTGVKSFESFDRIDELSTVEHVTPDYPPTFLAVGARDALKPQSIELIDALKKSGVAVQAALPADPNLGHDYMMNLGTAAAQQTLEQAVAFLKSYGQASS